MNVIAITALTFSLFAPTITVTPTPEPTPEITYIMISGATGSLSGIIL